MRMLNICECCEREGVELSEHHLVPKTTHKNKRIKKMFPTNVERNKKAYVCPLCHKAVNVETDFRDDLSRKEFQISGLCQECQDKTFC